MYIDWIMSINLKRLLNRKRMMDVMIIEMNVIKASILKLKKVFTIYLKI